jgi:hypothetical protein
MPDLAVDHVLDDLRAFLNEALATHGFAAWGLQYLAAWFSSLETTPENPDPTIWIGVPGDDVDFAHYASWKRSEAIAQLAHEGPVERTLSQQWIVYTYTGWELEYRPRLAAAHGCEPSDLKVPLLGDLRRLRHDVVHHRGVATKENAGRCEVVGHWVKEGDLIELRGDHFGEFSRLFPWDVLAAGPTG